MKKKRVTKMTFSKRVVLFILLIAVVDLQICIFRGLETVAISIITEIVAIILTYSVKAFYGKREAERTRLQEEQANYERDFERIDV